MMQVVRTLREDRGGIISQPSFYLVIYKLATMYSLAIGIGTGEPDFSSFPACLPAFLDGGSAPPPPRCPPGVFGMREYHVNADAGKYPIGFPHSCTSPSLVLTRLARTACGRIRLLLRSRALVRLGGGRAVFKAPAGLCVAAVVRS